jgi:hypothetical protein
MKVLGEALAVSLIILSVCLASAPETGLKPPQIVADFDSNTAGAVVLETPRFSLGFNGEGRPVSLKNKRTGKDQIFSRTPSAGFEAVYANEDGKEVALRLSKLSFKNNTLTVEQEGIRIDCSVECHERYMAFQIKTVQEPAGKRLLRLTLHILYEGRATLVPLDWMTRASNNNTDLLADWPWIWGRSSHEPTGGVALYLPTDDQDSDETLLHIWGDGGLPHPKVQGAWNVERARTWLGEWQKQSVDQSTMIVQAESPKDLYTLTDYAACLGMKKIYMHTDTWKGEYWSIHHSFLHVNPLNFPKGEEDLKNYAAYCKSKGLGIAIHTVSCDIGRFDPDYTKPWPDPRLAGWSKGTLDEPISEKTTVIRFKPSTGVVFPKEVMSETRGPNTRPGFMNINLVQIGNEFIEVGAYDDTDKPVWTLKDCRRGFYETKAVAYDAKQPIKGLYRPYGQAFVADSGSSLLDEVVRRCGEFCNRNGITHLECDGLEIHQDVPWGSRKFAWKVNEQLDHPTTSNTSSGGPLPFHVEYWFKSSEAVKKNHATGGVAGGDGVPLYLHHDDRPASGPYEILLKPTQRLGLGGRTFNLMSPRPMFGVSRGLLESQGLSAYVAELFHKWQIVAPLISKEQINTIHSWFTRFASPLGAAGNQSATDILVRPDIINGKPALTPLRLLKRPSGEINWGWGQEFGPLVPRQYLKPGHPLTVTNPYHSQEPEFVIRVMKELKNESELEKQPEGALAAANAIIDSYNRSAGQDKSRQSPVEAGPQRDPVIVKTDLMPVMNEIKDVGTYKLAMEGTTLTLQAANPAKTILRLPNDVPHWGVSANMNDARGIGMTVTGDGSNAILVFTIEGSGRRDYVVKLDFKGPRAIEIPTGEVAWSDPNWAWREKVRDIRYGTIRRANLGLGMIPPETRVSVKVQNLRILKEVNAELTNPVIKIGEGTLSVRGTIQSDHYLWYLGGDTVGVYDLNWNKMADLSVKKNAFTAPSGSSTITLLNPETHSQPWLECQFFVKDTPWILMK